MLPERDCIWAIMFSTGSEGNIRGMKKMNVTPIKIVNAHARIRCKKNVLNFTATLPYLIDKLQQDILGNEKEDDGRGHGYSAHALILFRSFQISAIGFSPSIQAIKLALNRLNERQVILEAAPPPPRTVICVLGVRVAFPICAVGRNELCTAEEVDCRHFLNSFLQEFLM